MAVQPAFLNKPMHEMTPQEWESLCDGCGLCCQIRLEDEDTGEVVLSNIACNFLDLSCNRCSDYANRLMNVPDCVKISPDTVTTLNWLPHTCAYRLVAAGEPLPEWHPLISGDPGTVHTEGPSMLGEIIHEDEADI